MAIGLGFLFFLPLANLHLLTYDRWHLWRGRSQKYIITAQSALLYAKKCAVVRKQDIVALQTTGTSPKLAVSLGIDLKKRAQGEGCVH